MERNLTNNGIPDCQDGSDEASKDLSITSSMFLFIYSSIHPSNLSMERNLANNGIPYCQDGSDEASKDLSIHLSIYLSNYLIYL